MRGIDQNSSINRYVSLGPSREQWLLRLAAVVFSSAVALFLANSDPRE